MPRYDIVFLDADNTLFDFDAAEHAALRLVLEERSAVPGLQPGPLVRL